jgi:hypothetical protein
MLTTYADVKEYMGLANDTDQALITRLISAASDFIKQWLNRGIESQPYTDTLNGTGKDRLMLGNYPITAVASVSVDGVNISPAANSQGSGYLFDQYSAYLTGYSFTRGYQNVVIAYTAGYTTVPPGIAQACLDLVALKYKERDRIGLQSKIMAGDTVTYKTWDLTTSMKGMLTQYQKRVPV